MVKGLSPPPSGTLDTDTYIPGDCSGGAALYRGALDPEARATSWAVDTYTGGGTPAEPAGSKDLVKTINDDISADRILESRGRLSGTL